MTTRRVRAAHTPHAKPAAPLTGAWLTAQLKRQIEPLRGARLCVAFSGGADSTALLGLLATLRRRWRWRLRAVHVNHHLQPGAREWARQAANTARSLGVPLRIIDARVRVRHGASVEALAREHRYAALARELGTGEYLLLAQHQDDQLETVLLQLLRGAGPAGLAAMGERAVLGNGVLLRPLLGARRAQLRATVQHLKLPHSEDPSNYDSRFDRNFLRQQVLPPLLARWPAAPATVSRSATLLAEAQQLLDQQADELLSLASDGAALSVAVLRRLSPERRRLVLRRWLARRGCTQPDHRRLREIAGPLLAARHDAMPVVRFGPFAVHRHRELLYAVRVDAEAPPRPTLWRWRQKSWLVLPGAGRLGLVPDPHGPLCLAALPALLRVGFRRSGERANDGHGHVTVKALLQQAGIRPWLRDRVPLLRSATRLLAVADLWFDPKLALRRGARARVCWEPPDYDH
ncbi:MAG TPA: tRNA lysidine(34) synthetase TilS [Steroidobacteraceae bacterium]